MNKTKLLLRSKWFSDDQERIEKNTPITERV